MNGGSKQEGAGTASSSTADETGRDDSVMDAAPNKVDTKSSPHASSIPVEETDSEVINQDHPHDDAHHDNNNNNNNNMLTCPICLHDEGETGGEEQEHEEHHPLEFACAPCGHAFCRPCLELLLFQSGCSPRTQQQQQQQQNAESSVVLLVPTLGVCPFCRARLSLFELKHVHNNHSSSSSSSSSSSLFVYEKDYNWATSCPRLVGAVYVNAAAASTDGGGGVGYGSFHFDTASSASALGLPYFNVDRIAQLRPEYQAHMAMHNVHWHAPTRTILGELQFNNNEGFGAVYEKWQIYLTFSSDLEFVRTGLIHKVMRRLDNDDEEQRRRMYPLDGTWKVVVDDNSSEDSNDDNNLIHVLANRCHHPSNSGDGGLVFYTFRVSREGNKILMVPALEDANPDPLMITMPTQATWDWEREPMGPPVDAEVTWTMGRSIHIDDLDNVENNIDNSDNDTIVVWKRVSVACTGSPDEVQYIGGASGRNYRRLIRHSPREAPTYFASTVWGNTFCQDFRVGLASYHFEKAGAAVDQDDNSNSIDGTVYISYEHPATGQWPPLDNGMPVPPRVMFRNISFPDPFTFCGSICWHDDYGTSWQRMGRWEYNIKFDSQYTCILSGSVTSYPANEDNPPREMSRYGESLVYINAALFDAFCNKVLAFPTTAPAVRGEEVPTNMHAESYGLLERDVRARLQREGASVRTMAAVHRVLTAVRFSTEQQVVATGRARAQENNNNDNIVQDNDGNNNNNNNRPTNLNPIDFNL